VAAAIGTVTSVTTTTIISKNNPINTVSIICRAAVVRKDLHNDIRLYNWWRALCCLVQHALAQQFEGEETLAMINGEQHG